jgi:anti-sigma regulatory factor (Ser/Thr protein kinase)
VEGAAAPLMLAFRAEPHSVGLARQAVSEFAQTNGADVDAVATCVSEAVANAIVHAYRERGPGTIQIRAARNGTGLTVTVADDGGGMAPNPDNPGLGLGLAIIGSLAEGLEIDSSPGGGTSVRMRFGLRSAPRDQQSPGPSVRSRRAGR